MCEAESFIWAYPQIENSSRDARLEHQIPF